MQRKRINIIEKYSELNRPLILDGAMGSLLLEKGITNHPILWTALANIEKSEIVKNIHIDYIDAGAEIITTNTFRTNPYSIKKSNLNISAAEFVKTAINNALDAINDNEVIIAGSNAPAEDCYQKERTISFNELESNHKIHIELLWESTVDIIWNETQSHRDEIEIICKYCYENKIPYVVNLFFDKNLKILSGEDLIEIIELISSWDPIAIGFNCIKPETFYKYIEKYSLPLRWGFYFNCGAGNYTDETITCGISPNSYIEYIKPLLEYKPLFIGTCCGSSPLHTKSVKEFFNALYRN